MSKEEIEARKRQFDQELAEWEEKGDPLCAWSSYMGWLEEKGLKRHASYTKAIQHCLKYFSSLSEYFSEVRLARIYISAAEVCKDPVTIFQHMHSKGIGAKFALYYKAYSSALAERGERQEAVRVLEMGIQQKARPLNLLQKALAELKTEKALRGSKAVVMDEKSERNEAFYKQPKVTCCYEKRLVYPPLGGEQSLEQIRACLPQYTPLFPLEDSEGECDMEITEAQTGHITMLQPLAHKHFNPAGGRADSFEVFPAENLPLNKLSPEEELEKLIAEKSQPALPLPPSSGCKRHVSEAEIEEQLEQLVLEKDQEMTAPPSLARSGFRDDFDKELFGEDEAESGSVPQDDGVCSAPLSLRDEGNVANKENLVNQENIINRENIVDQENIVNKENMGQWKQFDFTPANGLSVPVACSGVKELATRLNFSEAELSLHHKSGLSHSLHKSALTECDRSGVANGCRESSLAMLNTTLDCEKRAKLTEEQMRFEDEFANTEFHDGPFLPAECSYQPPSLVNDTNQSYGVFHDSWNLSTKTSTSVNLGRSTSRPLQALPTQEPRLPLRQLPQEPSFDECSINSYSRSTHHPQGMDSHYSCPPSHTADSFSVFEDASRDQSSFAPYHDSWAERGVATRTQEPFAHRGCEGMLAEKGVYHAPVGEPVMRVGVGVGGDMNRTFDQSFTQFDIPRPKQSAQFSNNSTPAAQRVANVVRHNITLDLSVIPPSEPTTAEPRPPPAEPRLPPPLGQPVPAAAPSAGPSPKEEPEHIPQPVIKTQDPLFMRQADEGDKPCLTQVSNLSTIMEESENYRSSQSSSRFTVSSGSSRFSSSSASSHQTSASNLTGPVGEINPFEPHIINTMLNKVGVSNKMELLDKPFQKLRNGCGLVLGGEEFQALKLISEGGFARVYSATQGDSIKAIKVQSPPLEWEVTAIELLHSRLVSNNLEQAASSFIQVERAYRFEGTSVIVMEHHPFGSLLDLVNSHKSCVNGLGLSVVLYLTCEVVTAVATLHQCGLLHADIKPDNFMIKDLRSFQDVRSALGRGLCLVDFGRAIDLQVFPCDVVFTGSNKTDQFQCPPMREGKPWKWQVDYFGVAATMYTILSMSYMDLVQEPETGHYKPATSLARKYRGVWTQVVELLINATDYVPLVELIQPLHDQLISQPSRRFSVELKNCFQRLLDYRKKTAK